MLSGAHAQTSYCETWNELNPAVGNRILTMEALPSNANTAPERTVIICVGVYLSVVPGILLGTLLTFTCNLTIGLVFGTILSISNSLLVYMIFESTATLMTSLLHYYSSSGGAIAETSV